MFVYVAVYTWLHLLPLLQLAAVLPAAEHANAVAGLYHDVMQCLMLQAEAVQAAGSS